MSIGITFLILFALMAIGVPIAFSLGVASSLYIITNDLMISMIPQKMTTCLESFIYVCLPLFILAGDIMSTGGITRKLMNIARVIVGRFKGGLAYVNVVVSMLFGGVQGMAAADTVAIGSILIPAMNEEGYEPSFSTAITVGSSTIGAIIPPSMLFIMFGCTTNVSISKIFISGVIPGILLGLFQMAYILYLSKSKKHRDKIPNGTKLTVKESLHYLLSGLPTLVLPVIIMVGICIGIVTTTESAVLAVVYAMGYVLISGEMTVKQMWECFKKSVRTIGGCMIILSTASLFGYIMTAEMIPQKIIAAMLRISNDPTVCVLMICVFLLIVGTFMDPTPATLILAPILLPVMSGFGMSPVHVAITVCFALTIGVITPPVGSCLFLASGISGLSMEKISKGVLPLITISVIELLIIAYVPFLTNWLPGLLLG